MIRFLRRSLALAAALGWAIGAQAGQIVTSGAGAAGTGARLTPCATVQTANYTLKDAAGAACGATDVNGIVEFNPATSGVIATVPVSNAGAFPYPSSTSVANQSGATYPVTVCLGTGATWRPSSQGPLVANALCPSSGLGVVVPPGGIVQLIVDAANFWDAVLTPPSAATPLAAALAIPGATTPGQPLAVDILGHIVVSQPQGRGGAPPAPMFVAPALIVATNGNDSTGTGTLAAPYLTLGKCQTVMQGGSTKTCYVRAGRYVLPSGGLHLVAADAGETFSVFPPDGVGSAILDGTSLAGSTQSIQWDTGATGTTVNGFSFLNNTTFIIAYLQANNTTFTNNLLDGNNINPWYGIDVYGNNQRVIGNVVQNMGGSGATAAVGIFDGTPGLTNSVIAFNTVQCVTGFGIEFTTVAASNAIFGNYVTGTGHSGGPPPTCGTQWNAAGTAIEDIGGSNELYARNTVLYAEGYALAVVGNSNGGGNVVSDNYLQAASDPAIDFIGGNATSPSTNPNGIIRRNDLVSSASIGMNVGDENDTCNGTTVTRQGSANNVLIANNNIRAQYEPITITAVQNGVIQGNTGNIGINTVAGIFPHYPSGVSFLNWQVDGGGSCVHTQDSTGNVIALNSFTSTNPYPTGVANTNSKYGILFETNQGSNTLSNNIFFPFGPTGTAAIQNNSGGSLTLINNKTTSTPVVNSPPLADAGPAQLTYSGATVQLNGLASRVFLGGPLPAAIYAWTQLSGPAVTLSGADTATPTFVAPTVTVTTRLGFQLTVASSNGSTFDKVHIAVLPLP